MFEFIAKLGWRPAIGDPSVMGWLTVAAYAAAAVLSFLAARRVRIDPAAPQGRRERRMWLGVAVFMALLCVNKQLDLQTLLTKIGRELAVRGGWYEHRRPVQFLFVLVIATVAIAAFVWIVRKTRSILKERRLLLVGLCFMLSFIIIRASSFHHVAVILEAEIWGIRLNWLLELSAIALIGVSAAQTIRHPEG
jgi:ABC-type Co2+ transport system permease subunit